MIPKLFAENLPEFPESPTISTCKEALYFGSRKAAMVSKAPWRSPCLAWAAAMSPNADLVKFWASPRKLREVLA